MRKPVAHQVHETDGGGVWKTGVCAGAGGMCFDAGAEMRPGEFGTHCQGALWYTAFLNMSMCRTNDKLRVAEVRDGETVRAMNATLATVQ